jgi:hypothetical protein
MRPRFLLDLSAELCHRLAELGIACLHYRAEGRQTVNARTVPSNMAQI